MMTKMGLMAKLPDVWRENVEKLLWRLYSVQMKAEEREKKRERDRKKRK